MRIGWGLALVLLAGCGGGSAATTTSSSTPPPRTQTRPIPTATIPTVPDQTGTAVPEVTTTGTGPTKTLPGSPEQQPGGAGDEEAPRVPVQFTYRGGKLTPLLITVPATFRIAVTVTFADTGAHTVTLGSRRVPVVRAVASVVLPGLAKGKSLAVTVDGRPAGRIASGLQPGP